MRVCIGVQKESVDQQSNKRTAYAVISQKVWCTCIPDNINQKKSSCFGRHSDTINIVNWFRHYTSFCTLYLLTSNFFLWFFDDWHSTLSFLLWILCGNLFAHFLNIILLNIDGGFHSLKHIILQSLNGKRLYLFNTKLCFKLMRTVLHIFESLTETIVFLRVIGTTRKLQTQ